MKSLKSLLETLNLTQRELAKKISVTENSVSRWINQPEKYPISRFNAYNLIRFAANNGIEINYNDLLKNNAESSQ